MIRQIGSQNRESIIGTEYRVLIRDHQRAILVDTDTGNLEEWFLNDHASGYVLDIGGKGYEFACTLTPDVLKRR